MIKTIDEIKHFIKTSEDYQFISKHERMSRHMILLTLSGSIAYGTNTEASDIDLRGICFESTNELIGLSEFDQYEDQNTDTVIYGLRKFIKLCLNNNPNILELLRTKEEHLIKMTHEGQVLRDHLHLFLSKKIINTYGQYANNQIKILKQGVAKFKSNETPNYAQSSELLHLKLNHYNKRKTDVHLDFIPTSDDSIKQNHITVRFKSTQYQLHKLNQLTAEVNAIVKSVKDNPKKTLNNPTKLYKTAIHILRLLNTGRELLEGKDLIVYRDFERELYLSIRNGAYSFEEIFNLIDTAKDSFNHSANRTTLQDTPNYAAVEDLMIELYKRFHFNSSS